MGLYYQCINTCFFVFLFLVFIFFFFFSSRRRHTRSTRDWSSDVCSSDLALRAAILLLADLETHIARAELRRPAPHQKLVAALERLAILVDRFGETVEPGRFGGQVRFDALAGVDAIPAARNNRAVLVHTERRHDGKRRLIAPGKAD